MQNKVTYAIFYGYSEVKSSFIVILDFFVSTFCSIYKSMLLTDCRNNAIDTILWSISLSPDFRRQRWRSLRGACVPSVKQSLCKCLSACIFNVRRDLVTSLTFLFKKKIPWKVWWSQVPKRTAFEESFSLSDCSLSQHRKRKHLPASTRERPLHATGPEQRTLTPVSISV